MKKILITLVVILGCLFLNTSGYSQNYTDIKRNLGIFDTIQNTLHFIWRGDTIWFNELANVQFSTDTVNWHATQVEADEYFRIRTAGSSYYRHLKIWDGDNLDLDTNRIVNVTYAIDSLDAMPLGQFQDSIAANVGLVNPVDSIVFNGDIPDQTPRDFKIYGDTLTGLLAYFKEGATGQDYINATQSVPFINTNAIAIPTGTPLSIGGLDFSTGRGLPTVEITLCDSKSLAESFAGVAKDTVLPNEIGEVLIRNFLLNYNTTAFEVEDNLYVDCDSTLTNVIPMPPDYALFIGKVLVKGVNGIVAINASPFDGNDTEVNLQGALNGIITQKQAIRDTVIGGLLYFETYNEENPLINLPFLSNMIRYNLNTTTNTGTNGYARVQLDYSVSSNALINYIYIDNSGIEPVLASNTTGFPVDGIRHSKVSVWTQAIHAVRGFATIQRFNNAVDGTASDGWISKAGKKVRAGGSDYESGLLPNVDIVTVGGDVDSINISCTSGEIYQFNIQTALAQLTSDPILWLNDPNASGGQTWVGNLNEIDLDATGGNLFSNNSRYVLTVFFVQNSGDYGGYFAVNSPTNNYNNNNQAINDRDNTAITSVPVQFKDITIRHFTLVLRHNTADDGTIINLLGAGGFYDDRGKPLGSGAGSGTGSQGSVTDFADNEFTIFNNVDPTKLMQFDASNITTGVTRTYTTPDVSDTLAVLSDIKDLETSVWEYEITVDAENGITVDFTIKTGAQVEFNGATLRDSQWSGEGTTTITITKPTKKYDLLIIRNN